MDLRKVLLECMFYDPRDAFCPDDGDSGRAAWDELVAFLDTIVRNASLCFPEEMRGELKNTFFSRFLKNRRGMISRLLTCMDGAPGEGEKAVSRYVATAARNAGRDILRKQEREAAKEFAPRVAKPLPEEYEFLKAVVAELDERQQVLFRLTYYGRTFDYDLAEPHWRYLEKTSLLPRELIQEELDACLEENGAKKHLIPTDSIARLMGESTDNVDKMRSRMKAFLRDRLGQKMRGSAAV